MSIDGPKFGFTENELKNNNVNPELTKFLEDNKLAKEEADILDDMFEENKAGIILISKENLQKLRMVIGSNSKTNYITSRDKQKIKDISSNQTYTHQKEKKFNNINHISEDGLLNNVTKIRLDEIVGPSEKIKFSIKLSKNSLYPRNMDGKQFNIIWGNDIRNGKQTYIFENGPRKGERVMISNGDKLEEYIKNNRQYHNEKLPERINKQHSNEKISENLNISERNKKFIESLKLPRNYERIAKEFASKLKNNEILTKDTPIALVDGSKKEMLYTINGKKIILPVLIGKNGLITGGYKPNDKKTPKGKIHRFNPDLSILAKYEYVGKNKGNYIKVNGKYKYVGSHFIIKGKKRIRVYDGNYQFDASNSHHSATVLAASLQSNLSKNFGGRYFHGVAQNRIDGRFNGKGTWGCVGIDTKTIRNMYYDVKKKGIGYGYVG